MVSITIVIRQSCGSPMVWSSVSNQNEHGGTLNGLVICQIRLVRYLDGHHGKN